MYKLSIKNHIGVSIPIFIGMNKLEVVDSKLVNNK